MLLVGDWAPATGHRRSAHVDQVFPACDRLRPRYRSPAVKTWSTSLCAARAA